MLNKKIIGLIIIFTLIISIISGVKADAGPNIGENEAKWLTQKYLNNHGLSHYKARTPSDNDLKYKAKNTKTGKIKWVTWTSIKRPADMTATYFYVGPDQYEFVDSVISGWFVPVYHHNQKVGTVYIDEETGKVWGSSFKKNLKNRNSPKLDMNVPKSVITEEDLDKNVSGDVDVSVPVDVAPVNGDVDKSGFPLSEPVKRFAFPLLCLGLLSGGIYWYFKK